MTNQNSKNARRDRWASGLFWSWNVIFLAFMAFGFAPRVLPDVYLEVRRGMIPGAYLVFAIVLACVPLAAVVLGLTVLRRAPRRLFALGYVIEGPLMLMLAIRFFLIRQATPSFIYLMAVAGLGMAAFLWQVLDPEIERRGAFTGYLRLFGLTLMLLTSLYAALWIGFYALPLAAEALLWLGRTLANFGDFLRNLWTGIRDLFRDGLTWDALSWVPFTILGLALVLYTATLFVLTPIAVPLLSVRAWWRNLKSLMNKKGRLLPVALVLVAVLASGTLFVVANIQPQHQAFALLKEPPKTRQQAENLLKQQETIRSGLLNAYLAPFRYISAVGEVRHVSTIYESTFGLTWQRAFAVQRLYEDVARPLLYDPVQHQDVSDWTDNRALREEPAQAARLYQRFFDVPIVDGERETIVRAARTTWSGEQAEAAVQAVDDREVHLVRQEINLQEHGDWAEVELYEVYQNQTSTEQEVVYYFNLPESAVITGVWLGDTPSREARYAYRVAPRGAAQTLYREETERIIDPALVEQIGPRQYRLRAYPVTPQTIRWVEGNTRFVTEEARHLYLWLTYQVFQSDGSWPLPGLAEWRNVYWDAETVRVVNGSILQEEVDTWLPPSVPASQPASAQMHRVDFPGGWSVIAQPDAQAAELTLPVGLHLAVVLDRSRSMQGLENEVARALERLSSLPGSTADVYLTASPYRGETPTLVSLAELDPGQILYFGGQNPGGLLEQFVELRQDRQYNAVLVLSDGSGYELGDTTTYLPPFDAPVWFVHLDGSLPLGYEDRTLDAIQASGGGVAGDIETALRRLSLALSQREAQSSSEPYAVDLVDGYIWSVLPVDVVDAQTSGIDLTDHSAGDGFRAFAARRLVLAEMARYRDQLDQLPALDRLHALAAEYSIVTPYSSMIVLVNEAQQRRLDKLEQDADRFGREFEALGETTPPPPAPLTGVPEPHEWLLLGLAALLLVYYARSKIQPFHNGL